jgi:hypothetical protein
MGFMGWSMVWFGGVALCGFDPPTSGRAVKDASLFDGGRGNMFTHRERAWTVDFVHAHDFDYCRAFFGGGSLLCSYSSLCILVLRLGD